MHDEAIFRSLSGLFLLTGLGTRAYFQLRANRATGRIPLSKEPPSQLIWLRAGGLILLGTFVAYLVNPEGVRWSRLPISSPLRWTGAAIAFGAWVLLVWTFRTLGNNLTPTVATKEFHTLVTDGPYRWIRHPFYLAASLFLLGISLLAANWLMASALGLFVVMLVPRTRIEEHRLIEKFGDRYRDYISRTGRFLPRFRRSAG